MELVCLFELYAAEKTVSGRWAQVAAASTIWVPNLISPGMRRQAAAIMAYLGAVVAPEPTDPPQPPAGMHERRIFGVVKALVWVMVSIGTGVALAVMCS